MLLISRVFNDFWKILKTKPQRRKAIQSIVLTYNRYFKEIFHD